MHVKLHEITESRVPMSDML